MTSSAGGAKGCSDHRFCAPPAYTAQLLAQPQKEPTTIIGQLIKSSRTVSHPNPYTNTNKEKFGSFFSRALAYEVNGFPR